MFSFKENRNAHLRTSECKNSDTKVASSQTKINENFANYILKKAKLKHRCFVVLKCKCPQKSISEPRRKFFVQKRLSKSAEKFYMIYSESQIYEYIARVHEMSSWNLFWNVRKLLRCSQLQRVEYDLWKYIQIAL